MHAKWPALRISNVEEFCEPAVRPKLQYIIPPRVVLRGGHVIGDDVEQNSKAQGARSRHETGPRRLTAEIVADLRGVYDIVAMLTAWNRLQARRQVHMADSQFAQIVQHPVCRAQGKSGVQLQPIGRNPSTAHDSAAPTSGRRDAPADCA